MKYYITKEGCNPCETTKERFYSVCRRKHVRKKVWIGCGKKVANEVVILI